MLHGYKCQPLAWQRLDKVRWRKMWMIGDNIHPLVHLSGPKLFAPILINTQFRWCNWWSHRPNCSMKILHETEREGCEVWSGLFLVIRKYVGIQRTTNDSREVDTIIEWKRHAWGNATWSRHTCKEISRMSSFLTLLMSPIDTASLNGCMEASFTMFFISEPE